MIAAVISSARYRAIVYIRRWTSLSRLPDRAAVSDSLSLPGCGKRRTVLHIPWTISQLALDRASFLADSV